MIHKRRIMAAVLLAVLYCAGPLRSAFPPYFNFQGKLTDDAGQPQDGTFDFMFELFTTETGPGSTGWTESHTVQVENGLYSVILGTSTSLLTVNFTIPLWLEITVKGDTLSPRYRLTSTPYSFYAGTAAYAASGGSADNLGNHTATQNLDMSGFGVINTTITFTDGSFMNSTGAFVSDGELAAATDALLSKSSATATYLHRAGGTMSGDLDMGGNDLKDSTASRLTVDSNMYVVGYASATNFFGNGANLTGIPGDNLGNHIASLDLDMAGWPIHGVSTITLTGSINLGGIVKSTSVYSQNTGLLDGRDSSYFLSGSSASVTYLYRAGGTMSGNIDMSRNQIKNIVIDNLSSAPGTFAAGQMYYETDTGTLWYYDDDPPVKGWVAIGGSAADNLGNHVATTTLNMSDFGIINTTITFTDGTYMGSTTPFASDGELTAATDALLSKSSATATYLHRAGGTMSGDIDMASGSIVNTYSIELSTISSVAGKVVISTYTEVREEVEASGFMVSGSRYFGNVSFTASTFTAVDLSSTPLPDTNYSVFCELDFNNSGYYINNKTISGFVISLSTSYAPNYSGSADWMIFRHR